ncbi:F0F1 ATP synthase subunit B [Tumidithrix elongata RA019]|uniref:ATP synthase subunit b n=1 Tax=Tumidithrix elongata BACA0141 TaxID=2716417 RepID=A0AAW9PX56_9CYAN|nr:F0F1 ATP synthase subunit B [Tumidithrix elongata RA019]
MDIRLFLLASEAGEASGFGLNSNILETNAINILILLGVLIYAGKGFLGKALSQRLETIESAIKDADKRKQVAIEQLADQQEKLAQAQAECDRLRQQAEVDAKAAGAAILATVDADIERLRESADQEIATEQERVLIQLRQRVAEQALAGVRAYFGRGLEDSVQRELVDRSISLLGSK